MGIDVHTLRFVQFAAKRTQGLGRVATIGRQGLHIDEVRLRRMIAVHPGYQHRKYADELLKELFGATSVESFDNSSYEGATHLVDLNNPLPPGLGGYDTVLDAGCIEHLFDAARALKSLSQLCRAGGQILHALPANNFCGHGFWQVSPELFFSLYSERNGYCETEVFLADLTDERYWFEVKRPQQGRRVMVSSATPLYVLCRTRVGPSVSHESVQQSDYVHAWSGGAEPAGAERAGLFQGLKQRVKRSPLADLAYALHDGLGRIARRRREDGLSEANPGLVRHRVSALI
jgi:hypothetical protein